MMFKKTAVVISVILALGFVSLMTTSVVESGYLGFEDSDKTLLKKLDRSIVRVLDPGLMSGGTGFFVEIGLLKTGIITNAHVCDDNEFMIVELNRKKATRVRFKVRKVDKVHDLCLLYNKKHSRRLIRGLRMGQDLPEKFDRVTSIGFPFLGPIDPKHGYATDIEIIDVRTHVPIEQVKCDNGKKPRFSFSGPTCLRKFRVQHTTLHTFPGNSGSPVVDRYGAAVGVIMAGDTSTTYGSMVPLDDIRKFIGFE